MQSYHVRIREIRLEKPGQTQALVDCPPGAVPLCGQYGRARALNDTQAALAQPIFLSAQRKDGFLTASPVPETWSPGSELILSSPLGRGFVLPASARRVAAAVFGSTASRLLPLLEQALANNADVSIFTDDAPAALPTRVEINSLKSLSENLAWADFLAVDVPLERVGTLSDLLGLNHGQFLPCPGQALVYAPMPCTGMAACGACAVKLKRGWKLTCEDGPVFNLRDLV